MLRIISDSRLGSCDCFDFLIMHAVVEVELYFVITCQLSNLAALSKAKIGELWHRCGDQCMKTAIVVEVAHLRFE